MIIMRYGAPGDGTAAQAFPATVAEGVLEYETTIEDTVITLNESGVYLLFAVCTTKATDAYASLRTAQITAQTGAAFGTAAADVRNILSNGTQRVTVTSNADGTLTIKPTAVTYRVKFSLVRVA